MLILYLIIEIILLYYVLGGIIAVLGSVLTTKELIKAKKIFRSSLKNKYCILLPVYHEQDIIQESINYFYSIFKDDEKVKIFIIATERENCKNSTYEMAKKQIEKMNAENILTLLSERPIEISLGKCYNLRSRRKRFPVDPIVTESE